MLAIIIFSCRLVPHAHGRHNHHPHQVRPVIARSGQCMMTVQSTSVVCVCVFVCWQPPLLLLLLPLFVLHSLGRPRCMHTPSWCLSCVCLCVPPCCMFVMLLL